eukprot:6205249-Pleurochrysis_carterae.AAC.2
MAHDSRMEALVCPRHSAALEAKSIAHAHRKERHAPVAKKRKSTRAHRRSQVSSARTAKPTDTSMRTHVPS